MEIPTVKRLLFWAGYLIFLVFLFFSMTSDRVSLTGRVLITILLAAFSAYFRFAKKFSFISIVIVIFAGVITAIILAATIPQFWMFTFLYVLAFYIVAELIERNPIGL